MAAGDGTIKYVRIQGIHCPHCVSLLESALSGMEGVDSARITRNVACLRGPALPGDGEIAEAVNGLGYETRREWISSDRRAVGAGVRWHELLLLAGGFLALAWGLNALLGYNVFRAIPVIDSSLGYGMLFVTGLLTGLHCISMCGAIGLSASADSNERRSLRRPLLYHGGRVLSYTLIGGLAGLFGSAVSIRPWMQGTILLAAGLCMLLMGLSMLGILRFSLPALLGPRVSGRSLGPFVVGLLNGLMPCGPLQAMQLYALSTGSFFRGALAMLCFVLGTVPLLLAGGAAMNLLRGRGRRWANQAASVLVLVLAVSMVWRGLLAFGVDGSRLLESREDFLPATLSQGEQELRFELDFDRYADVLVLKDVPVRMVIHAEEGKLTGCNNQVVCAALGFDVPLTAGDNVVRFTPTQTGDFSYTCWMNMLHNTIRVVESPEDLIGGIS